MTATSTLTAIERGRELLAAHAADPSPALLDGAQDYFTKAVREAEARDDAAGLRAAQDLLAYCYWHKGDWPSARVVLTVAIAEAPPEEAARLSVTLCMVEVSARRFELASRMCEGLRREVNAIGDDLLRARLNDAHANALKGLGKNDPAFECYTEARFHFELAGHARHAAATDNNLADLLIKTGRAADAHEYLDRAEPVFAMKPDHVALGHLCETRARAFVAEKDYTSAKAAIEVSLSYLDGTDADALAKSLRTKGRIAELTGDGAEARRCYLEAVSLLVSPGSDDALAIAPHDAGANAVSGNDDAEQFHINHSPEPRCPCTRSRSE